MAPDPDDNGVEEILEGFSTFLRAEVFPRQTALEEQAGGPGSIYTDEGRLKPEVLVAMREVRETSAAAGYYSMLVSEDLGGGGLGFEALFRVWEFIARECGTLNWLGFNAVAHWTRGPSHLFDYATPELRDQVLPKLLSGTETTCFAMSEPDAGSDVWMMRTRAKQVDGGWLISGGKQWITNAPYADYAVVFAVTDPELMTARKGGLSAFFVSTDAPGFVVDGVIKMFGHEGGDEGILGLSDVFVPDAHVLGDIGDGLKIAMSGVASGRLYNTARAVGLAEWALGKALDYAQDRRTFDQPIIENQGVSFPMAQSALDIRAARLMGLDAGKALDQGKNARNHLVMSKAFATEMAVRVVDRAMQIHGAMGFTNEVGLAEAWQQVRRACVADGTAEIMRTQIVRSLRRYGTQPLYTD